MRERWNKNETRIPAVARFRIAATDVGPGLPGDDGVPESGRWGTRVCDVVESPGQFAMATTNENFVLDNPDAWRKAWTIAGRAIDMWALPIKQRKFVVPNADHFIVADSTSPSWIKGPPLATIGAHNFYRIN
jgi:hypothetical protein